MIERIFFNLKSSLVGVAGAIVMLLGIFNIIIPQELALGILGLTVFIAGLFMKDKKND